MIKTLIMKAEKSDLARLGMRDNMAFVQALSTQIFYDRFILSNSTVTKNVDFKVKTRIRKAG